MPSLTAKTAIVTGADSGIGQAIAEEFAREGADVVVTYHSDDSGAQDTKRRVEALGRRALVLQLDVRQPDEVAQLFQRAGRELGTPFILVNNAGMDASEQQVADMTGDDWDQTLRTNLYGPFYCCQQFIRMRRQAGGQGKIINVTSVHEEIPRVGSAAYDASKGGLRNLTRTLALELAPDRINVNNLAPGMVLTPMNQEAMDDPKAREQQVQNIPLKRAAEPREMARLAVYLASPDSDYATGQSFTLDGGLSIFLGQGA